jgi:hypothetical protein
MYRCSCIVGSLDRTTCSRSFQTLVYMCRKKTSSLLCHYPQPVDMQRPKDIKQTRTSNACAHRSRLPWILWQHRRCFCSGPSCSMTRQCSISPPDRGGIWICGCVQLCGHMWDRARKQAQNNKENKKYGYICCEVAWGRICHKDTTIQRMAFAFTWRIYGKLTFAALSSTTS